MSTKHRDKGHRFGGEWTTRKLDVLAEYLASYTTALKKARFEKLYIDAFAGTGCRANWRRDEAGTSADDLPLPDLAEPEPQMLLEGSARRALATNPAFERYVFIERRADRCAELEKLKAEFPDRADSIEIQRGDANDEIQALCTGSWRSRRAVLFLDPYGMQVDFGTIEAIAATQAIDLWVLFPLGIAVNRLLTKSGEIPESWRWRLDRLFGTESWYEEFYQIEMTPTLFDDGQERVVKATMENIGRYFNERLDSIFAGVAPRPGVLRNSRNNPLYLFCFAVGNPRGRDIALRIANHLLKGMS
jgi:three-Cys-motif partner protein